MHKHVTYRRLRTTFFEESVLIKPAAFQYMSDKLVTTKSLASISDNICRAILTWEQETNFRQSRRLLFTFVSRVVFTNRSGDDSIIRRSVGRYLENSTPSLWPVVKRPSVGSRALVSTSFYAPAIPDTTPPSGNEKAPSPRNSGGVGRQGADGCDLRADNGPSADPATR